MSNKTDIAIPAESIPVSGDLATILARHDRLQAPQILQIAGQHPADRATALLAPEGLQLLDLEPLFDKNRDKPKHRRGTHVAHTLAAFIALTNRFKAPNSVIFANRDGAGIEAILDFHPEGEDNTAARFGTHRVSYGLPHSKEWLAWREMDGKVMDQVPFAAFIEDRIADVIVPHDNLMGVITDASTGGDFGIRTPQEDLAYLAKTLNGRFATPAELVTLSRGLTIREDLRFKNQENLSTGETNLTFESTHQDGSGAPLHVPNLFLIAIPVYDNGARYVVAVRLRYRRVDAKVKWFYQMYRVEQGLEHAFTEAAEKAAADTGLPLYRGTDR